MVKMNPIFTALRQLKLRWPIWHPSLRVSWLSFPHLSFLIKLFCIPEAPSPPHTPPRPAGLLDAVLGSQLKTHRILWQSQVAHTLQPCQRMGGKYHYCHPLAICQLRLKGRKAAQQVCCSRDCPTEEQTPSNSPSLHFTKEPLGAHLGLAFWRQCYRIDSPKIPAPGGTPCITPSRLRV